MNVLDFKNWLISTFSFPQKWPAHHKKEISELKTFKPRKKTHYLFIKDFKSIVVNRTLPLPLYRGSLEITLTVPLTTLQPLYLLYSPFTYFTVPLPTLQPLYLLYSPFNYFTVPVTTLQFLYLLCSPFTYFTVPLPTLQSLYLRYSPFTYFIAPLTTLQSL